MTSVFEVAVELLDHKKSQELDALALQKLCFYTFGWYAHLTGESLFGETFYAMQYGPVVGELLSAHAGCTKVNRSMMVDQLDVRGIEMGVDRQDSYKVAVVDAVWSFYGRKTPHTLITLTHQEELWSRSWNARRPQSKRGDMRHVDIIDYFLQRVPSPEENLDLPPALISRAPARELEAISSQTKAHRPFVDSIRALCLVS